MLQHKVGTTIFREGDRSQYLVLIKSGQVVLEIRVPPQRRRSILTVGRASCSVGQRWSSRGSRTRGRAL